MKKPAFGVGGLSRISSFWPIYRLKRLGRAENAGIAEATREHFFPVFSSGMLVCVIVCVVILLPPG